ncbi:urea carboxylase [Plasticicumulans lactativorans]|uniref:Biotin carboxylase n=1 Tax=Plasticicumulans lactativorans TaxID=1133106 RepID=A0A4R2L1U6_9GAMM|nr:urea carboxylase [Plasticicumulans lactativorans]TCO79592.1 urea carboxylase [Plasticicumulans lactativorans]
MFDIVLIANRGAIACRVIRTLKALGVRAVAVYTSADRHSRHVQEADQAIWIGENLAADSYLNVEKILDAARTSGAQAIHPGYGFLSENAGFALACEQEGIAFIGPTAAQMEAFGLKHTARALAAANGAPLLPGSGLIETLEAAVTEAARIGYPLMLKSTAGGGGIGMSLCRDEAGLRDAFASVQRLGRNNFGNAGVFLEKFVERARHIEVQVFGDGHGGVIALGERDCSLQRRNQKVIEETPAPRLAPAVRAELLASAERLMRAVAYRSAGTVEYIYDDAEERFYFLEVNTRLQVEHGVTEMVTGVDLVAWMLQLAAGDLPPLATLRVTPRGHAIQARVYAEDPARNFQPQAGLLTQVTFPADARCDTWIEAGVEVPPFYDPMLAKVIVHAGDRAAALARLGAALAATRLAGIETNLDYLRQVLADAAFVAGTHVTATLGRFGYRARGIEVLAGGTQTTVQDWPGRGGHWDVGVPPSGPMDDLAFRLANRIVGNPEGTAGLEVTVNGPTLRFHAAALVAVTGATTPVELDGVAVAQWAPVAVPAGSVLRIGQAGDGARAYLAVKGGLDVPDYLGSKATFTLGQFGGHGGRALRTGDVLPFHPTAADGTERALPAAAVPRYGRAWTLRVIYGPHGAPDFFTDAGIEAFFAADWEVHFNSSRTGVRLIGPKPLWARSDGGEAGLHPSNIHDNAYAIGTVDFTGDMPVILGPDGPSLGGFVCPATVVMADLWQLGQLRPGDRVRFVPVDFAAATALRAAQRRWIDDFVHAEPALAPAAIVSPVLARLDDTPVEVVYRPSGDDFLLIEYGPPVLDLALRFRAQVLLERIRAAGWAGVLEMTPGIRSLQLHYQPDLLPLVELLGRLQRLERELGEVDDVEVPARVVHLPLAWDDSQTRRAIDKYATSVRKDAPWCPSNLEFIRRINGLESIEQVREAVFGASYVVMGLGDVYLGAPVATPLDPRHRLVTTKYNPARTWTPENAVGIGGSYLCVYGMEGPGGYQFVGRTVQMWNRYHRTADFPEPWLLRFFDQIRFFEVSEDELLRLREDFPRGRYRLRIEPTTFSLRRYRAFLAEHAAAIAAFEARRRAAFDAERARWAASGQDRFSAELAELPTEGADTALAEAEVAVEAHVPGSVWQVAVAAGAEVAAGQPLVVLESMKMEITIAAPCAGRVTRLLCQPGAQVAAGARLLVLEAAAG